VNPNPRSNPSNEEISKRAREIWTQRGSPDGEDLDHWYQAERELLEARNTAEKLAPSQPSSARSAPAAAPNSGANQAKKNPAKPKSAGSNK
jgi:hypothetical protein